MLNGTDSYGAAQSTSIGDSNSSLSRPNCAPWWKFGVSPIGDVR